MSTNDSKETCGVYNDKRRESKIALRNGGTLKVRQIPVSVVAGFVQGIWSGYKQWERTILQFLIKENII